MLSLSPVNYGISSKMQAAAFKGADITDILTEGDKALNENDGEKALKYYSDAMSKAPDNADVYRKTAKAQIKLKDFSSAVENLKKYLKSNPDSSECLIELGDAQKKSGYYQQASESFEKAYNLDNCNDAAKRNILRTQNDIVSIYNPQKGNEEKRAYAEANLKAALDLTVKYMTPEFMSSIKDVTVQFGKTAEMGGTPNIAQYEDGKKTITVSDSYIYADPRVIAAYLVHESVHAGDKDAYTSVKEEQDAYEVAAKFWIENSNGIKDPEMDYAADLYKKSPEALSERVEEIYKLRDPDIAMTSPNHTSSASASSVLKESSYEAARSIGKQYDVIA